MAVAKSELAGENYCRDWGTDRLGKGPPSTPWSISNEYLHQLDICHILFSVRTFDH
jgi:hypothetical protein